ncbi:hypothetical protein [Kitasatospora sp. RG8]|nr:hypothetical protein [Kitasatospora sp. RG8]
MVLADPQIDDEVITIRTHRDRHDFRQEPGFVRPALIEWDSS